MSNEKCEICGSEDLPRDVVDGTVHLYYDKYLCNNCRQKVRLEEHKEKVSKVAEITTRLKVGKKP